MARNNESEQLAINIIRNGTHLEGTVKTSGDIRIDGTLKGKLISDGKLVVGETGIIEGEVFCKSADISGSIKATLSVKEMLQLRATASITGDILTAKIAIEPGANFTGNCRMGAIVKGMESSADKRMEKTHVLEEKTA